MSINRQEDLDLTRQQVQSLSSNEAIAAFFAYLRYPDEARLPMTAESLALGGDLARAVRHVERLSSVDLGALEVYLFELRSVTVGHTRALARAFRDRPGNYLLVLTDDYERLDFVLLERVLPEGPSKGIGRPAISLRPRVLTVDRRDPGRVALRVLRRFTWTEVDAEGELDAYAQYDKLRSAYVVAEWSEPLFNNRALFSDYYLNQRLPELPEWDDPAHSQAFRDVRGLMAQARRTIGDADGPACRDALIRPLLERLGFRVEIGSGAETPDLLLFAGDLAAREQAAAGGDAAPCAFALAYPWGRYLDGKDESRDAERPEENPGAQVVTLLEAGVAPWAIVTNGKQWRLYGARAHSRATNYYEVDLQETLASPDPALPFRYFYLFFRAAAYSPSPLRGEGRGEGFSFLDRLLDESATYARELGERLKERVFEQIFPHFSEGFIHGLGGPEALLALPEEQRTARLDDVYQGTLTFLYRLLFALYAESRDLLPAREVRGYGQIGVQRLVREIAECAGPLEDQVADRLKQAYSMHDTALYEWLLDLFRVIDRGDPERNVPVYNGGLFMTAPEPEDESADARHAHFLLEARMPDRCLALGLDRLARDVDPKRGDLGPIDYKSLGVRQLGSIYEGLLEFRVRVAAEKMAVVQGRKTEEVIPYAEAQRKKRRILTEGRGAQARPRVLPRGAIYLENDRRERKASGSYYTPDYIVQYIVRHTVGPVLDDKLEALRPRVREAEARYRRAVEHKRTVEKVAAPNRPALLRDVAGDVLRDLFDVKVLDPAMGSGHFLVEAVDAITDRLVRFLGGYPFLGVFFQGMRDEILAEMERQGVTVDPTRLTDVTLLKRHVLKRCMYGVDLNRMAVELAKVSLWLDCFTLGAPLSFLDHHLRPGNSLIGIFDLSNAIVPGSPRWSSIERAAAALVQISQLADVTEDQVLQSKATYQGARAELEPTIQRMNVRLATHFEELGRTGQAEAYAYKDPSARAQEVPEIVEKFETAQRVAEERGFFHWKLEFPEVFIDLQRVTWKEDGGFDAVVGNPPYVRVQQLGHSEIDYYKTSFKSAHRRIDISILFFEIALRLVASKGKAAYISSIQFFSTEYGRKLRNILLSNTIHSVVSFGSLPVFEEVTTYPGVIVFSLGDPQPFSYSEVCELPASDRADLSADTEFEIDPSYLSDEPWEMAPDHSRALLHRLHNAASFADLSEFAETWGGVITGKDEVYNLEQSTIEKNAIEQDVLLPLVRGPDVHRWFVDPSIWLLYPYKYLETGNTRLITEAELEQDYPNTYAYLRTYEQDLRARKDSRKMVGAAEDWYRIIRYGSYYLFNSEKILTPGESKTNSFALDCSGAAFSFARVYAIISKTLDSGCLAAILNSRILEFVLHSICPLKSGGYYTYSSTYLARAPIRRIYFTTPAGERERLATRLIACYQQNQHKPLLAEVDVLLPKNEDGDFLAFQPNATGAEEKSDVVHDLLAYLAQRMIDLNVDKQAEQQRFLGGLEAALHIAPDRQGRTGLDALTGKTYIRGYLGDYQKGEPETPWEQIEDVLHRNRRRLGVSLSDAALLARLRGEYERSLEVLRPIKARLARTDRLIDQVVYRLYGLTEEEIAIVEERA